MHWLSAVHDAALTAIIIEIAVIAVIAVFIAFILLRDDDDPGA